MLRPKGEPQRPGPNFAGHYIIMEFGWGSPCILMAMVDAKTGQIYNSPMADGLQMSWLDGGPWLSGLEFRVDSNLMIMRPCANDDAVYDHYFLWQNNRWKLIRKIKQAPVSDHASQRR